MTYPEAIATIKSSSVPWPIVTLHLRFGFKAGRACGECKWYLPVALSCGKAWSQEDVVAETLACGKFEEKE